MSKIDISKLEEWQGADNPPPLIRDVITPYSGMTYSKSDYVEVMTPVKAYYEVVTMPNGETETRWVLRLIEREVAIPSVFAWRPLPNESNP